MENDIVYTSFYFTAFMLSIELLRCDTLFVHVYVGYFYC